jgi:hypothetical protein
VATDDALAEVSTIHLSFDAERTWTRDFGPSRAAFSAGITTQCRRDDIERPPTARGRVIALALSPGGSRV